MYQAEILADSMSPEGMRLTTIQVTYPHAIHKDIMTHRQFCLAGDTELEFDLPGGAHQGGRRSYTMSIRDFVEKWHNGVARSWKTPIELDNVQDERIYRAQELAKLMNYSKAHNINAAVVAGNLVATKDTSRTHTGQPGWLIKGSDFKQWRTSKTDHATGLQTRLQKMRIRQLDEQTGKIITSTVQNCYVSGNKRVFEVRANGYTITGSVDHRILTPDGYERIGDLKAGSQLVVRRFGKLQQDKLDPVRFKRINGVWRNKWQQQIRSEHRGGCEYCGKTNKLEVHHRIPVHQNPALAFDKDNATIVCEECHKDHHVVQGWQGGTYLYGDTVVVEDIIERGIEQTYDLEIAGSYPNFVANGVIVHNSRNFQSFRAYPPEKVIETIERDPFIPESFDTRIKGMGQGEALHDQLKGRDQWGWHIEDSLATARKFISMDVAKAQVNFVLQDLTWITGIITATEWDNFFALRLATDQDGKPLARPEVYKIAKMMKEAIDHSEPKPIRHDEWHLPLVGYTFGKHWDYWKMVSVGRCARVSYLTHDGHQDAQKDIKLHDRLMKDGHMSPFEHIARPFSPGEWHTISEMEKVVRKFDNSIQPPENSIDPLRQLKQQQMIDQCRFSGNFFGWHQYRKDINYEDNFAEMERLNG